MDVLPVIPAAWRRIDEDVDMIDQGGSEAPFPSTPAPTTKESWSLSARS
jgi:hypothetical protein